MRDISLTIVKMPIESLKAYSKNARTHSDAQIKKIAASIKEFGFNDPIAIDHNSQIISGHGRLLAAKLLEMTEVPTVKISHLSAAQQKAYIIAHNKIALDAGWDYELLKSEIDELKDMDYNFEITGFDETELKLDTEKEEVIEEIKEKTNELTKCPACGNEWNVT
jgi:site-specific DNA-methyltransferase (adenine-specific)